MGSPTPISSSRVLIAIRSNASNRSAVKISRRRRRLAYSTFSIAVRSTALPVNLFGSGSGQAAVAATPPKSGHTGPSTASHSVITKSMRGAFGPVNSCQDLLRRSRVSWPSARSFSTTSGFGSPTGSEPAE